MVRATTAQVLAELAVVVRLVMGDIRPGGTGCANRVPKGDVRAPFRRARTSP